MSLRQCPDTERIRWSQGRIGRGRNGTILATATTTTIVIGDDTPATQCHCIDQWSTSRIFGRIEITTRIISIVIII